MRPQQRKKKMMTDDTTHKGPLVLEEGAETDYVLAGGVGSFWVKIQDLALYIHTTDEGVVVDIFGDRQEDLDVVASTYAFFGEGNGSEEEDEDEADEEADEEGASEEDKVAAEGVSEEEEAGSEEAGKVS
jgi:hypothetical protein